MVMNLNHVPSSIRMVPGTWVKAKSPWPLVDHSGILGLSLPDGTPTVVHSTTGGVQVTTFNEFATGRPVELVWSPNSLEQQNAALSRAYSRVGWPFDLLRGNCEHFASWVVNGFEESPQLRSYTVGATLLGLAAYAFSCLGENRAVPTRRRRKGRG